MLYQTGYLTIKSYDERMQLYTLGYPNKEVKIGFTRGLLGEYPSSTGTASDETIRYVLPDSSVVVSAPGSELRLQKRKNIRHMEMCGVELTKFHQQYFYSQKKLLSLRRILGI